MRLGNNTENLVFRSEMLILQVVYMFSISNCVSGDLNLVHENEILI